MSFTSKEIRVNLLQRNINVIIGYNRLRNEKRNIGQWKKRSGHVSKGKKIIVRLNRRTGYIDGKELIDLRPVREVSWFHRRLVVAWLSHGSPCPRLWWVREVRHSSAPNSACPDSVPPFHSENNKSISWYNPTLLSGLTSFCLYQMSLYLFLVSHRPTAPHHDLATRFLFKLFGRHSTWS